MHKYHYMEMLLGMLFFACATAFGQNVRMHDISDYRKDTLSKKKPSLIQDFSIGFGAAACEFFTYRYLDSRIQHIAISHQYKTPKEVLSTIGNLGLGKTNIYLVAGTGVYALISRNQHFEKATILLIGAHLISSFLTEEAKVTFQRHRPNSGDPYNTFDWRGGPRKNKSFFSAHAVNAFTTAAVFAICFKDKKWVPIVSYSLATLVGLSRIYENAHWASDVLAGAAVGYLSAWGMNKIYDRLGQRLMFLPEAGFKQYGVCLSYRF